MKYKTIVDAIRMRYNRLSTEKGLPKLLNEEILFEVSVNQMLLQAMYQIIDSETYNLLLVVGQDSYTVGSGASYIPTDIMKITHMELSDEVRSEVLPMEYSQMMNYHKSEGKPLYYCFTGQGSDQVLLFDRRAETAYTATIRYVPKFELFLPDSYATTLRWADYDPTATGWGGSLDLPQEWLIILMDLTLYKLIGDPNMEQATMAKAEELCNRKPVHSDRQIPYDDGVYSEDSDRVLQAGEDRVRRRWW